MSRFIAFACLFAFPAFAGPTENITGCETVAVEGSNVTVFVDPSCPAQAKDGGDNGFFDAVVIDPFGDLLADK